MEVFQSIDYALDDIAAIKVIRIERRRTSATAAMLEAVLLRILVLRACTLNPTSLNQLARLAGAIRLIDP